MDIPHVSEDKLKRVIENIGIEDWTVSAQIFYEIVSKICPLIYNNDKSQPWEYDFDEQKLQECLLAPIASMYLLEIVKLKDSDDIVTLNKLTEKMGLSGNKKRSGQICGKMFKSGDPTYTCKECALDDTCVLCHECFDNSRHSKHKYRMHTSYGGGYCDCNDIEAWTKDHACDLHSKVEGDDDESNLNRIPDNVKRRIYNVTLILLKYIVTLICWRDDKELPSFLKNCELPDDWPKYKVMLFNDETHTYDAVINALSIATSCSTQHAQYLATIVDREGRSVVFSNSELLCSKVKESIEHRTKKDINRRTEKQGPLEVKIMSHVLIAHQEFAIKLLQWLTIQAQEIPELALIIADVLMDECATGCKFGPEIFTDLPLPIQPKVLKSGYKRSTNNRGTDTVLLLEGMIDNPQDQAVIIRAPDDMEDADILFNPFRMLNEGLNRQRHESTNQNSQVLPPKIEKKHIKQIANTLECGHLSSAAQLTLFDRQSWKAARTGFHHLLMSTILMDNQHKANYGAFLIRNYEFIYQDYIDDDHEYDVSIISVNVQIYTVSSVAQRLISKENALGIIFEALKLHCQQYVCAMQHNERFYRFDFMSGSLPAVLRRSLVMFKDAIYLLQASPIIWDDDMIESFINGFETYTDFMLNMQDMDSVKRHADQHQLMDGEWETAFNIQVMMQEVTTLFSNWAKTNAYVHQRCIKILMNHINLISMCMPEYQNLIDCNIDDYNTKVVNYPISKEYVSVHQPIWRFLAGLLIAPPDILKHYIFGNKERSNVIKIDDSLEELNKLEWKNKKPIDKLYIWPLYMLMENPLRILILNSQCHAQLWRRNGFSLINQIHNYTAPLCRIEMFNRDIQMMQIIAANMNSNEFLIRFLERFTLDKWASKKFDELPLDTSTESTPKTPSTTPEELSKIVVILSEDFLHLLIAIIGERYLNGVGKCTIEDSIQRDIIHLLCTGPKNFSTIEKHIVLEPTIKSIKKEEALNIVADFYRPNNMTAGVFKLKEEYRNMYNPFYIHYTKQQLSQSEQTQLKEREKMSKELQACPPPKLIEFQPFFENILNIFESPLFIQILLLSLQRVSKRSRYSSEGVFHRILYLIGMGLNEQIEMNKKNKKFTFVQKLDEAGIYKILRNLEGKKEAEPYNNLLWWIIQQFDKVKDLEKPNIDVKPEVDNKEKEDIKDKATKRALLAQKKREQALKMMQRMQKRFTDNSKEIALLEKSSNKMETDDNNGDEIIVLDSDGFPTCIGPKKTKLNVISKRTETCILCQEEVILSFDGPVMVCCAYIQNSKLFTQDGITVTRNFQDPTEVFTPSHLNIGYNVSTCSHVMHYDCYKTFSENLWNRDRNRPRMQLFGQQIIDSQKHEYLCPLCKRLSNSAMPMLPILDTLQNVNKASECRPSPPELFEVWLKNLMEASSKLNKQGEKEDKKGVKTHSRKRSHSERSLNEIKKSEEKNRSKLQTSIGPLSPASDSGLIEASTSLQIHDFRGNSEPIETRDGDSDRVVVAAAEKAADNSIQQIFFSNFHKIKNIIINKKDNVPMSLNNFIPSIKNFLNYISEVGPEHSTLFSKEQFDVFRLYKSMTYVLRSTTSILKKEGKPLFGALNTRQRDNITFLSRLAAINVLQLKTTTIQESVARALTPLLIPLKDQKKDLFINLSNSVPDFMSNFLASTSLRTVFNLEGSSNSRSRDSDTTPSTPTSSTSSLTTKANKWHLHHEMNILNCDMLSLAIQLSMTIEYALDNDITSNKQQDTPLYRIPDGSVDELYVIYLTLLGHVFQTIAAFPIPEEGTMDDDSYEEYNAYPEQKKILNKLLYPLTVYCPEYERINLNALLATVKKSILTFLEPLALFYNSITLIPPPDVLRHSEYDGFDALCRYMGLPVHFEELLGNDYVVSLFIQWSAHLLPVKDELSELVHHPILPRELLSLPEDYTDLIRNSTSYKCPSMKISDHHGATQITMCLVCGELMCSQSYCCQKTIDKENLGACNYHMRICSGENNGIFLRIRECQVLLLTRKRGCFKPAPYVDQFGETDTGFRRGNPLKFHPESYKKLQRLWLYQEVTEEIINQYDMNHRNANGDWLHY